MMTSKAIKNSIELFEAIDQHKWEKIHSLMSEKVLLDFTSFLGGKPELLSPQQITKSWVEALPGFDSTHHQLSDFKSDHNEGKQVITFYGKTNHYLNDSVWTVFGNYYLEAEKDGRISLLKFILGKVEGDKSLPQKAIETINKKK